MCGIAGILIAPHADPRLLAAAGAMNESLRHRGPDGGDIWSDEGSGIALGHRRLAIIDLSDAGCQPMLSHGGNLALTSNHEVYNFLEMRPELEGLGHRFRGHSDTEVMLASFESFGIEASLRRFDGMFAFGLWDRARRELHLARDRLGKKPLYVALVPGALLFASELKALRQFPDFHPTVDPAALEMVLRQGWVPDRLCIYRNVFKLPPGTMLTLRAADLDALTSEQMRARARPWWSLADAVGAPRAQVDPAEAEAELDQLLRRAVRARMLADVPLGAFLSGGIDSSAVVALMQAQSSRPVRTFTIGFDEVGYDEAAYAARVARHLGTEHTELRVTAAEARAVIPELPHIWDEPFADESQIPTLLVSRLARRHVTVALSGDGGDESFGGYARHFTAPRLAQVLGIPIGLRRTVGLLGPGMLERIVRATAPLRRMGGDGARKIARVLDASDDAELYARLTAICDRPAMLTPRGASIDSVPDLPDLASRMMYRDTIGYLPGDVLVKLDRASMSIGLEGRCPLLDHHVVEFAWGLPTEFKVRGGKGKWLLRRVLGRYVPEALFERPKAGFNVPIGTWLRGPLRDWAETLLAAPRLREEGFLDPVRVHAIWREHLSGKRDSGCALWAILMLESWLDSERQPGPTPLPQPSEHRGIHDR